MTDMEKVIKGLLCIKGDYIPCATCKYADADGCGRGNRCKRQCASDAIALLKEQEPIAPSICNPNKEPDGYGSWWYLCGKCKKPIDHKDRFCKRCGQAVKWDD